MLLRLAKPIRTQQRNKVVYIIGDKRFKYNLKTQNVTYLYPTFKQLIDEFGLQDFLKRFKFFLKEVIGIEVKRINSSNYFSNFETKKESDLTSKMTYIGYNFLDSIWMGKIDSIMSPHIKKRIVDLSKVNFEHIVNGNKQDFIFTDLDSIDIPKDSVDVITLGDGNNIVVKTPFLDTVTRNTPIITIIDDKIFLNEKDIFFKSILNKLSLIVPNPDSLNFLRKYFYEYFTKYIK